MQLEFPIDALPAAAKAFTQRRRRSPNRAFEINVMVVRETPAPQILCDTPQRAYEYWQAHVATRPDFDPMKEHAVVFALNTRRRIICHHVVGIGSLDTVFVHPRELFRPLIACAAASGIFVHNHPSGDPAPSEGDIKVSRELMRAGQLLRIDVLDAIVIGEPSEIRRQPWLSLRELGYFYS
jgi:DNA repair protein RadC